MVFDFEKVLGEKNIPTAELPKEIQQKIKKISNLCEELVKVPDDSEEETQLNEQIDALDAEISQAVEKLEVKPKREEQKKTKDEGEDGPDTDSDGTEEEKTNSSNGVVAVLGILTLVGIGLAAAAGVFSGNSDSK